MRKIEKYTGQQFSLDVDDSSRKKNEREKAKHIDITTTTTTINNKPKCLPTIFRSKNYNISYIRSRRLYGLAHVI